MATSTLLSTLTKPSPLLPFQADLLDDCYIAGDSFPMQKVRSQLLRIAPYMRMALIVGEPGTGTHCVARILHDRSAGSSGPFVLQSAHTFTSSLLADDVTLDVLKQAQGGTLVLHDLCELSLVLQNRLFRLLRLLEESRVQRWNLRIVAISRRDLRVLAAAGVFHEELYRRVAAVQINLPPLRDRIEDLPQLSALVLAQLGHANTLSAAAILLLQKHAWTSNIRELRGLLEEAAISAHDDAIIEPSHLHIQTCTPAPISKAIEQRLERLQDVVQRHVLDVLTHCSGNKLRASEVLGISRSTLYRMLDTCAVGGNSEFSR